MLMSVPLGPERAICMSPGATEMEGAKPSAFPMPDKDSAVESRFADLCKAGLGLGEVNERQARTLFNEIKPILLVNVLAIETGSSDEDERLWSGFVLYSVKKLSEEKNKQDNEDGRFTLPRILRAAKLKNAWQKLGAMPPEEAMQRYIMIVSELYPSWATGSSFTSRSLEEGNDAPTSTSASKGPMGPVFSSFVHEEECDRELKLDVIHASAREGEANALLAQIDNGTSVNLRGMDKLKVHEDVDHHGACYVPYPQPKMVRLPRDFIEKQKAYFAEIDAFELPVEEANESELE